MYFFGCADPFRQYYEMLDNPKNNVVDIKENPIVEVKENGILTQDGTLHEFDIIALATGFDSVTGGMKNMGLKDIHGVDLGEKWSQGTYSYLGMTCADMPNMFFLYGAQGPTAFSNGPSCVELQGDWIVDAIKKLKDEGITYLNATREGEEEWRQLVQELSDKTLFPHTNSWYTLPSVRICGGFHADWRRQVHGGEHSWQAARATELRRWLPDVPREDLRGVEQQLQG